jgi:hypothetical protein
MTCVSIAYNSENRRGHDRDERAHIQNTRRTCQYRMLRVEALCPL